MRVVHKLGYVVVFDDEKVFVYSGGKFLDECYFFDPSIDGEIWQD